MDLRELHPSTTIGKDSRFWYGVEAEGSNRGKQSIYIAEKVEDEEEFERLISAIVAYADQIFLVEAFSHWIWYAEHVFPRIAYRALPLYISVMPNRVDSVCRYRESFPAYKHAHLIVRVYGAQWLRDLKGTDQVSVGVPYDLVSFSVDQGTKTSPRDYSGDHT